MCDAISILNPLTGVVDPELEVDAPPVPSYDTQMSEALRAQIGLMPELVQAEQQYGPQFTDLALQNQQRYLLGTQQQPGMLGIYSQAMPEMLALQSQARAGDIADVNTLGPQALQASRGFNPQQTALMDALNQQALQQVQLGGQMSPDQQRMIRNSVLGQASNQGWGYNPGDLAEAARQASGYSDQLQQQRMLQGGAMAGINQSIWGDPYTQILGRTGQSLGTLGAFGQQSAGATSNLGPSLFQPESQMQFDIWNTGYTGKLGAEIASAQNKAQFWGDALGAMGSMFGGMGACYIAREIYGLRDQRWLKFRHWLYTQAPDWFRHWYERNGQAVAAWLKARGPLARCARPLIKRWMDARIRGRAANPQPSTINHQPS